MPLRWLAQRPLGIHRLHPHQLQESDYSLAIPLPAFPLQHRRQAAAPIYRTGQVQLVQPPHQGKILRGLHHRLVLEPAARDPHQLALPSYAQFGTWHHQVLPEAYSPNCLHFFLSQSASTVSWPIFSCSWAISSWLSSPSGREGSNNSGRWSRITPFHCVTWTGCTWYSRAICPTVLTPIKASNPTLALKAPVYRFRFVLLIVLDR